MFFHSSSNNVAILAFGSDHLLSLQIYNENYKKNKSLYLQGYKWAQNTFDRFRPFYLFFNNGSKWSGPVWQYWFSFSILHVCARSCKKKANGLFIMRDILHLITLQGGHWNLSSKTRHPLYMCNIVYIPKICQIVKSFARSFHQA